jgi:Ca2+-binding RTX toxin-like protein
MAVATAFTAINMNNWQFHELNQLEIAPTQVTAYEAGFSRTTYYYGFGFGGDVTNGVTSGTVQEIWHYVGEDMEQYRITGLSHSAVTVQGHLENSPSPGFLPFLFSGKDTLTGSASADQLNGYNGNDKINGGLGADKVNGGAGNDTITWGDGDTVNGAAGTDVLKLLINLNLVSLANTKIRNIETIDMRGGRVEGDDLELSITDVLALSSSTNTLRILGDANDRISIDTPSLGTPTVQGSFDRYVFSTGSATAIVLIESDINNVF